MLTKAETEALRFMVKEESDYTLLHLPDHGLFEISCLHSLRLPEQALNRRHLGLVLSGRMPVWLFSYLIHEAHPFAWAATYDPRLQGAVVVARHTTTAPQTGELIPISLTEAMLT